MRSAIRLVLRISLILLLCSFYNAYAVDPGPSESDLTTTSFPALPLEPQVFAFPDEDFVRIALKIQLGTASIQERRAWYRAAERYAPFQAAPPAGQLATLDVHRFGAVADIVGNTQHGIQGTHRQPLRARQQPECRIKVSCLAPGEAFAECVGTRKGNSHIRIAIVSKGRGLHTRISCADVRG